MTGDARRQISPALKEKFLEFITDHSPSLFSRRLRTLLFDYLIQQQRNGFPPDFGTCLWELSDLFALLDCAADEMEKK
jgi:hypothetical protein